MNTLNKIMMRSMTVVVMVGLLLSTMGSALAADGSYTVKSGDSLTKIARLYNTTVAVLVESNKAQYPCLATNAACLQVGWVITVPGGGTTTTTTGVTTNPGTYVVLPNDSLAKIATKFGVSYSALVAANKTNRPCLSNTPPCALQIGWTLNIPAGAKPAASTTAGATSANNGTATGDPAAVIGQYVAALNARDAAGIKALLHPDIVTASTDTYIAEMFRYANAYQLTFKVDSSQVVSQSATEAQVSFEITGESANDIGFGTDAIATVVLKPYQGGWRLYDQYAGRIEFIR